MQAAYLVALAAQAASVVPQREEGDQVAHPWLPAPPSHLSHLAREAARFPSRLSLPVDPAAALLLLPWRPCHPSLPVDPAAALPAAALLSLPSRPCRPCPREEQTGEHLQVGMSR